MDDGKAFPSKILRACAGIHLQGPSQGPRWHPYPLLTPRAPLDLLGHVAQVAEQLTQ